MNKLPFTPPQDVLICQRQSREAKSESGLVLPVFDDARDDAMVLAAGAGRLLADHSRRPMACCAGDTILFPITRGQKFSYFGIEYIAIREEHVIGRVVDDAVLPLNDFAIAEQLPAEHVNPGGVVVIPSTADDRDEATLLAVGPGRVRDDGGRDPMGLHAGERVLYNKRMGDHFTLAGRKLVAFREEHVVCVTVEAEVAQMMAA